MPNDNYPDLPDENEEDSSEMQGNDEGGETALIPKSILAGKDIKPGDKITLKIVHTYDDEIEVEYSKSEPDEEETDAVEKGMSANEELDSMGEEKSMMS